jgi:hypothetical protein
MQKLWDNYKMHRKQELQDELQQESKNGLKI